jgi:hypothetical protein
MKKHMIQRFSPDFSRLDKNTEILDEPGLSGKHIDFFGPDGIFKFPILWVQLSGVWI